MRRRKSGLLGGGERLGTAIEGLRAKIKGVLVYTLGVRRGLGLKNTLYLFLYYLGSLEIGAVKYLELSAWGGGEVGSLDVTLEC